jgi:hypothetical protein
MTRYIIPQIDQIISLVKRVQLVDRFSIDELECTLYTRPYGDGLFIASLWVFDKTVENLLAVWCFSSASREEACEQVLIDLIRNPKWRYIDRNTLTLPESFPTSAFDFQDWDFMVLGTSVSSI